MSAPIDTVIYHICTHAALASARVTGEYRDMSLEREGFIHLSRAHQVLGTALAYFSGVPDLILLVINPSLLRAPLVYEAPAPIADTGNSSASERRVSELFPHCYGPVNLEAIVDVVELAQFNGIAP